MAKQSKISRTRELAVKIQEALDTVFRQSVPAYEECMRVQDIGVQLAYLVNQGYVSSVSDEGQEMLTDTLRELTLVIEHGLAMFLGAVEEHRTILEYASYGETTSRTQRGMVVEFNASRTAVKVTDPESLLSKQDIWVSLLWAPKTTKIIKS